MSTARQVPFENAVFVGDSPQDMHGENADEQLANPQKRICLIEFLHLGLIIVCQGSGGAATMSSRVIYRDALGMPHRHKVPSETR